MKLELKHFCAYLPHKLKVQYKGIVNSKEFSAYNKLKPKEIIIFGDEYHKYCENYPEKIEGYKISEVKQIRFFKKKECTIHLGTYQGHLKTCNLTDIKPILYQLSKFEDILNDNWESDIDIRTFFNDEFITEKGFENLKDMFEYKIEWWSYGQVQVALKYHIDIYDLIENNLAIDKTTLK